MGKHIEEIESPETLVTYALVSYFQSSCRYRATFCADCCSMFGSVQCSIWPVWASSRRLHYGSTHVLGIAISRGRRLLCSQSCQRRPQRTSWWLHSSANPWKKHGPVLCLEPASTSTCSTCAMQPWTSSQMSWRTRCQSGLSSSCSCLVSRRLRWWVLFLWGCCKFFFPALPKNFLSTNWKRQCLCLLHYSNHLYPCDA